MNISNSNRSGIQRRKLKRSKRNFTSAEWNNNHLTTEPQTIGGGGEWCLELILDAIRFYYCDGSNKLQTVENCIEHQALGRCITSLCWRPDGKAIAVGLEDGTVSLHDVELDGNSHVIYAEEEALNSSSNRWKNLLASG
ncbi:hypothetical protein K1719_040351 [Acacia pycnantha]|nr:hypothetical protein K1719_040351 [Acacia pycnantha]